MAAWRFARGWRPEELAAHLANQASLGRNFDAAPEEMTPENGWRRDGAAAVIGREPPGRPVAGGAFAAAARALDRYEFSDPRIVEPHFDPAAPLAGRDVLLEIKVLGLHYLSGVRVTEVRSGSDEEETIFGFRIDTLDGHIERGSEWFVLRKDHRSGEVRFSIDARWRPGEFPNWWSRVGFRLLAPSYRRRWRRHVLERLTARVA